MWKWTPEEIEESKRFFEAFLGKSAAMRTVLTHVEDAARTTTPVLIRGDVGTGKELVARMIHIGGGDPSRPFSVINTSALSTPLLEDQLFGGRSGPGAVAQARHGTLLLDEIEGTPARFLERIFGEPNIRVIATTSASARVELPGAHQFLIPPMRALTLEHAMLRSRTAVVSEEFLLVDR